MAEETFIESEEGIKGGNITLCLYKIITLIIDHYKAILPCFCLFLESKVEKGLFCQMIFLQSQWMDFQKFK